MAFALYEMRVVTAQVLQRVVLRAAPGLPATELATPVRILGGGTVLWLSLGLMADRLLRWILSPESWLPEVLGR